MEDAAITNEGLTKERNLFIGMFVIIVATTVIFGIGSGLWLELGYPPESIKSFGILWTATAKILWIYLVLRLSRFLKHPVWLTVVYCVLAPFSVLYLVPFVGLLIGVRNLRRNLRTMSQNAADQVPEERPNPLEPSEESKTSKEDSAELTTGPSELSEQPELPIPTPSPHAFPTKLDQQEFSMVVDDFLADASAGMTNSKLKQKYELSDKGLENLLGCLRDRHGMTRSELRQKYGLSGESLQGFLEELMAKGTLNYSDIQNPGGPPVVQITLANQSLREKSDTGHAPTRRQISANEIVADIKSGMTTADLKDKYRLTDGQMQRVFAQLMDRGLLKA